ncbi:hypothetical protein [Gracilimonas tropica]|uniref:hypothetical protein n=1 Tax=Gracilimonas tropica TaxID=454600 RepID=UPI0003735EDB|nr:hypothetical protein [Gracilimonas tropica]
MADNKIPHGHSFKFKGFENDEIEYMLLKKGSVSKPPPYKGNIIDEKVSIEPDHDILVIRQRFKNNKRDAFQVSERTSKVRLTGNQYGIEKKKGKVYSITVFDIAKSKKKDLNDHDVDIEPPQNPIPLH